MANNSQGVAVTVTVSQRQIDELAGELRDVRNGLPRALSGAINKLLPKGRTEVVDQLMKVLAIKRGAILKMPSGNPRITLDKANPNKLSGTIRILARAIGLINFTVKEFRRKRKRRKYGTSLPGEGVDVQVYRGGPTTRYKHSFIDKGQNSNRHIFVRRYAGGKVGTYKGRFPLDRRQGPSLLTVYKKHPEIDRLVEDRLNAELQKELDSQVSRLLKKPIRKR